MRIKLFSIFMFVFGLSFVIQAGQIKYDREYKKFPIFNKKNGKIINYLILQPDEKITFNTIGIDTLMIFSRIILNSKKSYSYELISNGTQRTVKKKIKSSRVSKGLNGEKVSTYSKLRYILERKKEKFEIKNLSSSSILIKVKATNSKKNNHKIEYIKFSPHSYENDVTLVVDNKAYTYYSSGSSGIQLDLEGPIVLKIISRALLEKEDKKVSYNFKIYKDDKLLEGFSENALKSKKATLQNEKNKTPSTGDVNIIKLSKGIHHLRIESELNENLIFNFYISKSSVEIRQE
ncbi:MAG: hypothetical protein KAU01_00295 [Candidatus Cloacimonetes bacterium]|nr:hypothetical protein [Candidatus Cloacimonadota bacterium]